jgi:hypothetical protein
MLSYQKLLTEKYMNDHLKNENKLASREENLKEMRQITGYLSAMGVMMGFVILYLSSQQWIPMLQEKLNDWGISNWAILPW